MPTTERWKQRQKLLAGFGEFILRTNDLDAVLTEACRLVAEAMGTGRGKILEIQPDELLVRAGVGWGAHVLGIKMPLDKATSETHAIDLGEPVIINNVDDEHCFELPPFMQEEGVKALANVPIFLPGRVPFGLIQVDDTAPRTFDEDDTEFLKTYSNLVGPVIDRLITVQDLKATELPAN